MLVVDAMIGQDAVKVASSFDEALGIDSVLLTKLDSDTRGGAALSVLAVIEGFLRFRPESGIRGVILNQCTAMTYASLSAAIEERYRFFSFGDAMLIC